MAAIACIFRALFLYIVPCIVMVVCSGADCHSKKTRPGANIFFFSFSLLSLFVVQGISRYHTIWDLLFKATTIYSVWYLIDFTQHKNSPFHSADYCHDQNLSQQFAENRKEKSMKVHSSFFDESISAKTFLLNSLFSPLQYVDNLLTQPVFISV